MVEGKILSEESDLETPCPENCGCVTRAWIETVEDKEVHTDLECIKCGHWFESRDPEDKMEELTAEQEDHMLEAGMEDHRR